MEKFCPRCGKTVKKVFGSKNVCSDCFRIIEDFVEIPDEIEFVQCSVCGSYRIKNVWKEFESDQKLVYDVLKKYEREDVEMSASFKKKGKKYDVKVLMEVEREGEQIRQVKKTLLFPEQKQCLKCSRYQGGYFEAIVQLRGGVSEDLFGELMERAGKITRKDRSDFVSDVKEIHEGYDLYVSSLKMARFLIDVLKEDFDVEENWSRELVGRKDGEEVFRTVVSVRVST